jgi:hypothetical protein
MDAVLMSGPFLRGSPMLKRQSPTRTYPPGWGFGFGGAPLAPRPHRHCTPVSVSPVSVSRVGCSRQFGRASAPMMRQRVHTCAARTRAPARHRTRARRRARPRGGIGGRTRRATACRSRARWARSIGSIGSLTRGFFISDTVGRRMRTRRHECPRSRRSRGSRGRNRPRKS